MLDMKTKARSPVLLSIRESNWETRMLVFYAHLETPVELAEDGRKVYQRICFQQIHVSHGGPKRLVLSWLVMLIFPLAHRRAFPPKERAASLPEQRKQMIHNNSKLRHTVHGK